MHQLPLVPLTLPAPSRSSAERAMRWLTWRALANEHACLRFCAQRPDWATLDALEPDALAALSQRARLSDAAQARLVQALRWPDAFARELEQLPPETAILERGAPGYPERLLELGQAAPWFVYLRGDAEAVSAPAVAVVGSRRADVHHLAYCHDVAAGLARAGVTVVSGGALGVDGCVHRAALACGTTVVVLPSALDRITPRRHRALIETIAATPGCALLSAYPLGCEVRRHHFARRNALIAALSQACIVGCAGLPSGALITARAALELGRRVEVVPWRREEGLGEGGAALVDEGASVYVGCEALLSRIGRHVSEASASEVALSEAQREVVEALERAGGRGSAVAMEQLEGVGRAWRSALVELELMQIVRREPGGRYRLLGET